MQNFQAQVLINIENEISRLKKACERDRENLDLILGQSYTKEFKDKQKLEMETGIQRKEDSILSLQERKQTVLSGDLSKEGIIKGDKAASDKPKGSSRGPREKDGPPKKYVYEMSEKNLAKGYGKYLSLFNYICDSVPDYMLKNLSEMPNNKGYIWRKCWFFGLQKPEYMSNGVSFVLFERSKGRTLIHEYCEYEYRLYEKKGSERRKLVLQKARTPKKRMIV